MSGFNAAITAVFGALLILAPAAGAQSVDQLLFRVLGSETGVEQSCNFRVRAELGGAMNRRGYRVRLPNYQLTVATIPFTGVTNAIVDQTFDLAATLLQTDQGGADANCCVDIRRSGNVDTFQFADTDSMGGFGVISNQAERDAVLAVSADIKIVLAINFCSQMGTFAGCTMGGTQIVPVASPLAATFTNPMAIAHELGHQAGLCHVAQNCAPECGTAGTCAGCGDPLSSSVMYFRTCGGTQGIISAGECSSYQADAGQ